MPWYKRGQQKYYYRRVATAHGRRLKYVGRGPFARWLAKIDALNEAAAKARGRQPIKPNAEEPNALKIFLESDADE